MIDTQTRDPERTLDDLNSLVEQAVAEGMVPLEWKLGFFCVRDLIGLKVPDWAARRKRANGFLSLAHFAGAKVRVTELEDRIRLIAGKDVGGNLETKVFTVDRRTGVII